MFTTRRNALLKTAAALTIAAAPVVAGVATAQSASADGRQAFLSYSHDSVGQGIQMETTARVSPDTGLVDGEPTHTWTTWWGVGGHGSVAVELLDANGNVIGVTNPQTYGVDAKSVFWGRSSRYDYWSQTFNPIVTQRAYGMKILHTSATRDNFLTDLRRVRDNACAVWGVITPGQPCPLGPVN